MRRTWLLVVALVALPGAASSGAPRLPADLPAPVDYVLARLDRHPVVILGEAHWIRHDAELVAALAPGLAERRAVLAMETLLADDQEAIDRLLAAPEWRPDEALALQRAAAWPYREYLEILHAAWRANREHPGGLRVLALGPPPDWRDRGLDYDRFLADRVGAALREGKRVLVYCGLHHAFTRYHQPELDLSGRATAFMDRMGNRLRREFGERVFLVLLHRPLWCGSEPWSYCLPLDGAIDCAASRLGRPVGFDLAGTELGALAFGADVYYAHGYGRLRLDELADGYVWLGPLESYRDVEVLPLAELAPDDAALAEVADRNPFSDEPGLDRARLEALWREETERRADSLTHRRWRPLLDWRDRCP